MSDVNLLLCGCVVTFIGVAGAYSYIREAFTSTEERFGPAEARIGEPVRE